MARTLEAHLLLNSGDYADSLRRGDDVVIDDASSAPGEVARAEAGETVLVLDDEPTVRMLVAEVIEDLGYTAIEVGDGPAALKVLNSGVRLDRLISDVGLPGGMKGRQVADAVSDGVIRGIR